MTLRISTFIVFAVSAFSGCQAVADAACPDLGVDDQAARERFCAELSEILLAPYDADRAVSRDSLDDSVRRSLLSSPELSEAYRSDPKRTLALIARIRAAGGLNE